MSAMTLDRLAELMEARFQDIEKSVATMATEVAALRIDTLEGFHRVNTRIDRLGDEMRQRFRNIS